MLFIDQNILYYVHCALVNHLIKLICCKDVSNSHSKFGYKLDTQQIKCEHEENTVQETHFFLHS